MKPILILSTLVFLFTLFFVPVTMIFVSTPYDAHKPFFQLDHADHIQWGTLLLEWAGITVVASVGVVCSRKKP